MGPVKDLRSDLMLSFESTEVDGRTVYQVRGEGEARNPAGRLRAITGGISYATGRWCETEDGGVAFGCGARHDQLMRLLLPYARNVSGTQDMLEADALRGQMTTGTLGFTPPT